MKVLVLKPKLLIKKDHIKAEYERIVKNVKENKITWIDPGMFDHEVVDIGDIECEKPKEFSEPYRFDNTSITFKFLRGAKDARGYLVHMIRLYGCVTIADFEQDVKFNGPATIIFWSDDTKTVVKAHDEEVDYEKGLAMAIAKKALGNKGNYFNEFKKWLPEEEEELMYPKMDIPLLSDLFKPKEFSFEVKSTSINGDVLKKLTEGAETQTIQMSFEAVVKPEEKEPEDIVSEEFFKFSNTCKYSKAGYASHGDDHTRWDSYCHHKPHHGEIYCREQNCPIWAAMQEVKRYENE